MHHPLQTALLACALSLACYCAAAAPEQGKAEPREVKVWVNTDSGVYHCPGTKWYGTTKQGKYIGECAARTAGYRPAYRKLCGSTCKEAQKPAQKPVPPRSQKGKPVS